MPPIACLNTPLVPNLTSLIYPLFKWLSLSFTVSGHVPFYKLHVHLIILNHIHPNSMRDVLLKAHKHTSFCMEKNIKICQEKSNLQYETCYGFLTFAT